MQPLLTIFGKCLSIGVSATWQKNCVQGLEDTADERHVALDLEPGEEAHAGEVRHAGPEAQRAPLRRERRRAAAAQRRVAQRLREQGALGLGKNLR